MKTLLTGGTGLVGYHIAKALVAEGRSVRAAVRDVSRARAILPADVELVEADIVDAASLEKAIKGCQRVYHCAGLPEQWLPDVDRFRQVNVEGTRNMLDAARNARVERFVYTSTIDVFAAEPGAEYDESVLDDAPKHTFYERSKQEADRLAVAALEEGLPVVFTHPSAVYGPGPRNGSGLNGLLLDLARRKVPAILPGGMPVVLGTDLAAGCLAAEETEPGSRFIFSDRYYSLREIAEAVAEQCEDAKVPMTLPNWLASLVSFCGERIASIRKKPPLIAKGELTFLRWQARPNSAKAHKELGWNVTPFSEGIRQTLDAHSP